MSACIESISSSYLVKNTKVFLQTCITSFLNQHHHGYTTASRVDFIVLTCAELPSVYIISLSLSLCLTPARSSILQIPHVPCREDLIRIRWKSSYLCCIVLIVRAIARKESVANAEASINILHPCTNVPIHIGRYVMDSLTDFRKTYVHGYNRSKVADVPSPQKDSFLLVSKKSDAKCMLDGPRNLKV